MTRALKASPAVRRPAGATVLVVVGVACALTVTSCSTAVSATAGAHASDPVCSRVVTALPDRVAGSARRETTAQAAVAWGDPPILVRCGVDPPAPSTRCVDIRTSAGVRVDWVMRRSDGRVVYVTYGRVPTVELSMPDDPSVVSAAPVDVAGAVALTRSERSCT